MDRLEKPTRASRTQDEKQYLDDDDDERSPLGADIFFKRFGFTVDEAFDADDEEEDEPE